MSSSFFLEIADDGAGIDPEAVRRAAEARGVELQPGQDPLELLFEDGMSTRQEVTDLSGRGVGLSAVRQACEAAGGRVLLTSEVGKGTKMLFEFRRPIVKTGALEQRVKRHWSLSPLRNDYDESATRVRVAKSVRAG